MSFSEWREVKVSEIGKIVTGKTPKTAISENYGGNIPFLTPSDDMNIKKVKSTARTLSEMGLNSVKNCLLPAKSICVSCIGSVLGKVVLTSEPTVTNQQINSIVPDEKFDPDFIYYGMTILGKHLNYLSKTSTAVPIINKTTFSNFSIIVPTIEEQKSIAHILSTLDDKIEVNNQINKTLENMAQTIFKQWFVDFEFPNEDGEPYKSSGGEMVESELGLIPKGWEVKPFEDAFYFQEGPGIRNWQYVENGTKFINIRCIQDNDLYLETANMISFEEAEGKYKHFMIDSGDIVMSTSGTLGKYAIVREEHLPLCLNTSVIRFKPLHGQEHYSCMYAYLTSNEFLNHLTTKASGSVQKNFGPMHLRQIKLLYPNVSIIKLLNVIISPIIKSSLHTKKENDKLKKLRDTLLPKLMSGEIRVPLDSEGDVS